jgi:FMN phosphatase YigB (HAD superfamily)
VNVVLFDLDNTLFDRSGAFRTWATAFAHERGYGPDAIEWLVAADEDGFADRRRLWSRAAARFGLIEPVEVLVAEARTQYLDLLEPDPSVLASLSDLRRADWKTCVVTNGPGAHQHEKAKRLDILGHVDAFCASGDLGIAKPDSRIFFEALRRVCDGLDERHTGARWMVGDSPTADIGGGRTVGLQTIWMHRGRTWRDQDGPPPHHAASDVPEAVSCILNPT